MSTSSKRFAPGHAEIYVAGYPSPYGGADTELDHLIDLWRLFGIGVHLVPNGQPDARMRALCDARGCITHAWRPDIFRDRIVVSFCNGDFLKRLPDIATRGRPRAVLWANCMTWTFPDERAAHAAGLIDRFLFQSKYQRDLLRAELERDRPVVELEGYRPYFSQSNSLQQIEYACREPDDYFGVGRVSRDDAGKYPDDMWRMFAKVCAPRPVKTFVLGFGPEAMKKCGRVPPCNWMDYLVWSPGAVPVRDFFQRIHCLVHKTGGSRENWPRAIIEAMAAGVPVVAEASYGLPEMIVDGVTGFLCESSDEMTFRASELAFDEPRRKRMIEAARQAFLSEHADAERCIAPWKALFEEVRPVETTITPPGLPRTERVSIVIAARNMSEFVAEAVQSALDQTVICEVIAVDDCSIDGTPAVLRQFESRVKVIELTEQTGVCAARNRGADAASGDFLLFLDGDDILPPDFVERHLHALCDGPAAAETPFVYGPCAAFGLHDSYWDAPEWDAGRIWEVNFVNTSALWRTSAFNAAGRWQNGRTLWDWDLALRGQRLGVPRRSTAVLSYRQHAQSWSRRVHETSEADRLPLLPPVRRRNARLSVVSILSGRLPDLVPQWLDQLAEAVRWMESAPPELILLDNSGSDEFRQLVERELARYRRTFSEIRVIDWPGVPRGDVEAERLNAVAEFMARSCNALREAASGDLIWIVEDDILVPAPAGQALWKSVTDGWIPPHGVSAVYRNRHAPERCIGGWHQDGKFVEPPDFPDDGATRAGIPVDYTGTGCLMFWKARTPQFVSHVFGAAAHDWAFGLEVTRGGGHLLMLPHVRCQHARTASDWV